MALSTEQRLQLGVMDPQLAELLKTVNIPQIDYSDPAKAIANLRSYMQSRHQPPDQNSNVAERNISFPARDGFQLRARVYEPRQQDPDKRRALVVYLHGGGWVIGSPEDSANSCRRMVQNLGVVCIAPSYRQAPEHPFPAGIDDAWDGVQWLAANADAHVNVSLSRGFIVGGSSAGGNMTAVISHLARDANLTPAITGLFLLAPMILPPETKASLPQKYRDMYLSRTQKECRDDDPVRSSALEEIFYTAAQPDVQSPLFVPYIWPTGHKELPRTYFQVCGMDVMRDEALIYEQALREENGVETRVDVYPGMPHVFWGAFARLRQSGEAAVDFEAGVAWLLKT